MTISASRFREIGPIDPRKRIAVLIVEGYDVVADRSCRMLHRRFEEFYDQLLLVCIGPLQPAAPPGTASGDSADASDSTAPASYLGVYVAAGTDPVQDVETMCFEILADFPRAMIFVSKLIFTPSRWYHPLLHGNAPEQVRRRLEREGIPHVVLPVVAKL